MAHLVVSQRTEKDKRIGERFLLIFIQLGSCCRVWPTQPRKSYLMSIAGSHIQPRLQSGTQASVGKSLQRKLFSRAFDLFISLIQVQASGFWAATLAFCCQLWKGSAIADPLGKKFSHLLGVVTRPSLCVGVLNDDSSASRNCWRSLPMDPGTHLLHRLWASRGTGRATDTH